MMATQAISFHAYLRKYALEIDWSTDNKRQWFDTKEFVKNSLGARYIADQKVWSIPLKKGSMEWVGKFAKDNSLELSPDSLRAAAEANPHDFPNRVWIHKEGRRTIRFQFQYDPELLAWVRLLPEAHYDAGSLQGGIMPSWTATLTTKSLHLVGKILDKLAIE